MTLWCFHVSLAIHAVALILLFGGGKTDSRVLLPDPGDGSLGVELVADFPSEPQSSNRVLEVVRDEELLLGQQSRDLIEKKVEVSPQAKTPHLVGASREGAVSSVEVSPVHNPPIPYPDSARRKGREGVVLLRVSIDAGGVPVSVSVLKSSGTDSLDKAAEIAIQKWKFKPSRVLAKRDLTLPIRFRLEDL